MDYLKIYSYNGIHLGQHISEFYSTLVPENIFFQGMSISYVFQKDNKLCLKRKNNAICDENTIAFYLFHILQLFMLKQMLVDFLLIVVLYVLLLVLLLLLHFYMVEVMKWFAML
ncbi:hypothetical protein FNP_1276 [Fusobacterium polymorphum ATCC 10953]|uniref:Uncharacterized protein n=1 Tax=Fusobacterium polymorphum ATCC 10953 TaxID=393480 RepID=A5TVY6_FUSNP|nr:hypothetical protein [Fusobacterium polymorphum]EDK89061.1 hypothetical protein FNP_1276 [Fusobacterium polymorphum ATCC 10953]